MPPEAAVHSPWRGIFSTPLFKKHLTLVAIDEAHCISEWLVASKNGLIPSLPRFFYLQGWVQEHYIVYVHSDSLFHCRGRDFRTAFAKIGGLRALTQAPFMALTASAPPAIQETISKSLHLKDPTCVLQGLDRPNIYLSASAIKSLNVSLLFSPLCNCLASYSIFPAFCKCKELGRLDTKVNDYLVFLSETWLV